MRGSGGNPTADRQISDGDVEAPLSASMRVDQYQSDREREIESESPSKAGASSIEEKDEEKEEERPRKKHAFKHGGRGSTLPLDPTSLTNKARRGSATHKLDKPIVTVVTEVSDFVAISIVKFHLRKEATTQALYQVVISLYMLNAFSGKIANVNGFLALASDILFAAFYLGAIPRVRSICFGRILKLL